MPKQVYIYGDSLLKATMPDEGYHYHFHYDEVLQRYPERRTQVVNRSKMGATISKGESLVQHDLNRGLEADYALVAYGGNDSDYDWAAIDADATEPAATACEPDPITRLENRNLLTVGYVEANAALRRTESRGAHARTDYPESCDEWAQSIAYINA